MQNISDKADSTAGATGELTASEYNNHKNELQGTVDTTAQTLSAATLLQLSKALFINGAGASAVQDSGSVDSIILSPVTGASGLVAPDSYAHFDGGLLLFTKSDPNTSTAVTVNFGQTGTELGAKSLVRTDASVPLAGDVEGLCLIQWDNTNDRWVLLRNGAETFGYDISSVGTINPKFQNNIIFGDTSGGAFLLTIGDGEFIGQRVKALCDGVGLLTVTFTGKLATGDVVVSDTFALNIEWTGTKWVAVNEVTADYVSGNQHIIQSSDGTMTNGLTVAFIGNDTSDIDGGTISHSVNFVLIEEHTTSNWCFKVGGVSSDISDYLTATAVIAVGKCRPQLTEREQVRLSTTGSAQSSANTYAFYSIIKGKY